MCSVVAPSRRSHGQHRAAAARALVRYETVQLCAPRRCSRPRRGRHAVAAPTARLVGVTHDRRVFAGTLPRGRAAQPPACSVTLISSRCVWHTRRVPPAARRSITEHQTSQPWRRFPRPCSGNRSRPVRRRHGGFVLQLHQRGSPSGTGRSPLRQRATASESNRTIARTHSLRHARTPYKNTLSTSNVCAHSLTYGTLRTALERSHAHQAEGRVCARPAEPSPRIRR